MDAYRVSDGLSLFADRRGTGEGNIRPHHVGDGSLILEGDSEFGEQSRIWQLGDGDVFNEDSLPVDIPESDDELDECRLAGSRRADGDNDLTCGKDGVDV